MTLGSIVFSPYVRSKFVPGYSWAFEQWEKGSDNVWKKTYPPETEADKQLREAQERKAELEKQKEQRKLDAAKYEQIAKLKAEIAALEAELK